MIKQVDILKAYQKFIKGKREKRDVQRFMFNMEDELESLYVEIANKSYKHRKYSKFYIYDPKRRQIDKAEVRDRIVHQLVYDYLVNIFDKKFYFHSYAARKGRGTHLAINVLFKMMRRASGNFRKNIFILKCDVKKFFHSIDHEILYSLIKRNNIDGEYQFLIKEIIGSFNLGFNQTNKGIPLGNLTSQIFANIYLNELDRFIKHELKVKYYIRYMDDFIVLGEDTDYLYKLDHKVKQFLAKSLQLELRDNKANIRKMNWGIDFLGYTQLPYWRVLRTKTKMRMFRNLRKKYSKFCQGEIGEFTLNQSVQSYLGLLKYCNG